MSNVLTILQVLERLKADGLPLSEYALRLMVKRGAIPVRYAGKKALIYYPNVISYIQCADGCDNRPVASGKG